MLWFDSKILFHIFKLEIINSRLHMIEILLFLDQIINCCL